MGHWFLDELMREFGHLDGMNGTAPRRRIKPGFVGDVSRTRYSPRGSHRRIVLQARAKAKQTVAAWRPLAETPPQ